MLVIYPIDQYVIDAIRKERKRQNVSQSMLAFGIGVSKSFIGQAESPKCDIKYSPNHINEIFGSQCCQISLIVDDAVIDRNSSDHCRTFVCQLLPERLSVAVAG